MSYVMNVAILGAGSIARTMSKTIRGMKKNGRPVELYAVASRSMDKAQAFAAEEGVCKAYRCECDVEITCGNKMLENDEELYQIMSGVCREQLGPESVLSKNVRGFGGDDMADFFCEGIPGCYYLLGMGNPAKGSTAAHHNKDFLVDEDVLDIGVELQVRAILRYLDMQ